MKQCICDICKVTTKNWTTYYREGQEDQGFDLCLECDKVLCKAVDSKVSAILNVIISKE
jgi:hypothetical protein